MSLEVLFSKKERPYTGELRPHLILQEFGLKGSALVAYRGPCHVKTESLVDWEDRLAGESIRAKEMLHFQAEFFGWGLREAVVLQRLWIAILGEELRSYCEVERRGDDLFVRGAKLSVSIVTASPVSQLLHIGINIDADGAPQTVRAIGLQDLEIPVDSWAARCLEKIQGEWSSSEWACAKVRPVF